MPSCFHSIFSLLATFLSVLLLTPSCGGGGGGGGGGPPPPPPPGGIVVTIAPSGATVPIGSSQLLMAVVTGCTDCTANWSVTGGAANGTVSPAGPSAATTYTAPFSVPIPVAITVTATSNEDPTESDTATITVADAFGAATEFGLSGSTVPQALVIGDYDGDANQDIATANLGTDDVAVLLGDGTGALAFNDAVITSGADPVSIAQGVFDAGAVMDVAAVNFASGPPGTVGILLGDGAGSFTAATPATVGVGTSPQSVAAGDFDNDGSDDLAVANFISEDVTVLGSNGDGTFTVTQTIDLSGSGPYAVATGFIDGGINRDLAVADLTGGEIWILLGNGDGTFAPPPDPSVPGGTGPVALIISEFNGASADLAVVNVGIVDDDCDGLPAQPPGANQVAILLGDGLGGFGAPTTYPIGSNPRALAAGDFNQDGNVDLVTANFCDDNISLLFGNGDGTFQAAVNYSPGVSRRPTGVAAGDLNNDTFDDVVTTNAGTDNVSVFLNNN